MIFQFIFVFYQQNNCSCLSLSEIGNTTVEAACNQKRTCRGDKYAYCSYHANDNTSKNSFVVYKKGKSYNSDRRNVGSIEYHFKIHSRIFENLKKINTKQTVKQVYIFRCYILVLYFFLVSFIYRRVLT